LPAAYFTGHNHGQSKEARCDAQEKLETWPGQRQACTQEGHKAHDAEKGKVRGPACAQGCRETHGQETAAIEDRGKEGTKKSAETSVEVPVEDTIIDAIEEPVPGVVVVTEYETIRTATPISSDREPKPDTDPETEKPIHGMRPGVAAL
jgi:hypothetical protein